MGFHFSPHPGMALPGTENSSGRIPQNKAGRRTFCHLQHDGQLGRELHTTQLLHEGQCPGKECRGSTPSTPTQDSDHPRVLKTFRDTTHAPGNQPSPILQLSPEAAPLFHLPCLAPCGGPHHQLLADHALVSAVEDRQEEPLPPGIAGNPSPAITPPSGPPSSSKGPVGNVGAAVQSPHQPSAQGAVPVCWGAGKWARMVSPWGKVQAGRGPKGQMWRPEP